MAPALAALAVRRLVPPPAVGAVLDRQAGPGRSGIAALRNALADWPLGDHCPDSMLEFDVARLLRDHGLSRFEFHLRIEGFEVDFADPGSRLILECDGFEFHAGRDAFELDRYRDATLAAAGWLVVRVTWRQVRDDPSGVIDRLRRTVAHRSVAT